MPLDSINYGDYDPEEGKLPEIVCLCGSTRFHQLFDDWNKHFTLKGKIVLSIGCVTSSDEKLNLSQEQKDFLDELHKRKIDLADSVFIINKEGYIGESTRSEINYALKHNKPVRYMEEIEK